MTRRQAELECERRRQLVLSRAKLEFTAWFAQHRLAFPPHLERALEVCSEDSCRVGDLCAFERGTFDPDKTPDYG